MIALVISDLHLVRWYAVCTRPLLIAARRPDYASMILLIRLGADLFTVNQARRNVLQLLAVKVRCFVPTTITFWV